MSKEWKGHVPTTKPSTKAVSGFFMGSAIPPQFGRINKRIQKEHDGKVNKVDRVRFS